MTAASTDDRRYVLTLGCPDTTGIVARIATFLAEVGGSIVEAAYHADQDSGWFFTRQAVRASSIPFGIDELREKFAVVAEQIGPDTEWTLSDTGETKRVVLLVSKEAHCLHDILGRVAAGELKAEICAVVGNHPELETVARRHGIDYHYVSFPKDPAERGPAFEQVRKLVDVHDPHAVVLARFMQVLPAELCEHWAGRALNIHHSFLPLPSGVHPRRETHWCDLPLRHRRARCRPDHRAGRDPGRSRRHGQRHGPPGARRREARAGARSALASRGSGAGARSQDSGVQLIGRCRLTGHATTVTVRLCNPVAPSGTGGRRCSSCTTPPPSIARTSSV